MALIKSAADLKKIRLAGPLLGKVLAEAKAFAQPGRTLLEVDALIHKAIVDAGARPSFLGYEGFPNASCLSLNDEVVHGIPNQRILKEGDLLGIDVGLWLDGVCVDAAVTVGIGTVSEASENLLETTQLALAQGIAALKPFRRVGAVSRAVQMTAEEAGLGIVRALTGHGVGHQVHEAPEVPNVGKTSDGILLRPGMVLAIEPMLTLGRGDVVTDIDGWTVRTRDGSLAAQFEHTVIVTEKGAEIVTKKS